MSKFGTIEFSGKSGKLYSFNVYSIDNEFRSYSAVYCVTNRSDNSNGGGLHNKLLIGTTDNIANASHDSHFKKAIESFEANCICTHREESESARKQIMDDLIEHYHPPCN